MKTEQLLSLCQRHHALLLKSDEQTIVIAVVDTPSPELMEALRFATQKRIDIECWSQERMDKHQHEAPRSAADSATGNPQGVTDLLNQILEQALRQRASDIHIEPAENQLRIRLRVDGVLHALPLLEAALAAPIAARLKVLGNLDIAEHRLPQDGQFTLTLTGRTVSFRIATLPCRGGEKIVLRLLHQVEQALDLEALGLSSRQLAFFPRRIEPAAGVATGYRAYGEWQNRHPVQRAAGAKPRRGQYLQRGRSAGDPAYRAQPNADQPAIRAYLPERPAGATASGSGYRHGRRNSRCRDRRNRH